MGGPGSGPGQGRRLDSGAGGLLARPPALPAQPLRPQLGQALLRHSEDDAALIAYADEAVRRFPHDPVAVAGYGHALLEIEGPDAALPVLRAGFRDHPDHPPLHSSYTNALIQVGAFAEAAQQLEAARRINARSGRHDPKLDQLVERLGLAQAGCLPEIHRREPVAGSAGDLGALSDIAGNGLVHAADLGESTLFRHASEPTRADQAIRRLPAGPERDTEQGLWIAASEEVALGRGGGLVAAPRHL